MPHGLEPGWFKFYLPLDRDHLNFPHHLKEGLKSHKVKEIYPINFDEKDTFFDITKQIDLKIKAISCHKSQVSKETSQKIKESATQFGKEKGYRSAEGFKRIFLKY